MKLQCDICCVNFDLDLHRPKVLPCGHSFCNGCVQKITLKKRGRKCPTCRKDLDAKTEDHPDNLLAIQIIEEETFWAPPPFKVPKLEDARVKQLEGVVAAARNLLEQLQQMIPIAVETLNRKLESSVTEVRQLEETLEKLQRGEPAADDEETRDLVKIQLHLGESLRLLTTNKIRVVCDEGEALSWTASEQPEPISNILPLLLLQLWGDGQVDKVDETARAATHAVYVGPPLISVLTIDDDHIDDGQLQVNNILRDARLWKNVRSLKKLKGRDSEKLLRVVAPHLEELAIVEKVEATVLEEVKKMPSLKRLFLNCGVEHNDGLDLDEYPDLPLNLEELVMHQPSLKQLRCVQRMPKLRSLEVHNFVVLSNVSFTPPQHGGLLWLSVSFNEFHIETMLSLIRAHSATLRELWIACDVNEDLDNGFYFPDLGQSLAACGLHALRRLVLNRDAYEPCEDVACCLLQRRTIAGVLPSSIEVICENCYMSVV